MIRVFMRCAGLLLLAILTHGIAGAAQPDQNAGFTRGQLQRLLQQYPPSRGEVLRLDPSLLTNRDYLKPYPALSSFLVSFSDLPTLGVFLLGALAALIVAAPVALYFVLSDK